MIKIVTICCIVVTVFEYRYNYSEYDNDWENVKDCKDMVNGSKCGLLICVNMVYQKSYNV